MSLEPKADFNGSHVSWRFEATKDDLTFEMTIKGTVNLEFAKHALADAIDRKDGAITLGDGASLDLILGGFPKEAINDFGRAIRQQEQKS